MRLLIVQYGGDYREAYRRLSAGGAETYHAQRYVIDSIAKLGQEVEEVIYLSCETQEPYNEVLTEGFRAIGAGVNPYLDRQTVIDLIAAQKPTHLVLHFPMYDLFQWAVKHRIRTVGLLADSFQQAGWRNKIRTYLLARMLNQPSIEWVANHGVNACRSLQKIGVRPDKIVPWDWIHTVSPRDFEPKTLPPDLKTVQLVYVGAIGAPKGVGDILDAIAELKRRQISVHLKAAGRGDIEQFTAQAQQLQILDQVEFLGLVPHNTVTTLMRQADMVVVPSWHDYPEGFPLTIYEGLCSRTPLIVSDHPMFVGNLQHGVNAMIFPQRNAIALANSINQLLNNPTLYAALSQAALPAWERLQIPVKWADFIRRWMQDSPEDRQWLSDHCLASGRYDERKR